ncbi:capsule assembly Wzi family protein [Spirosoma soli]|uniref:Capsule assembly Wzi family protein n=1 Tax=Spirosoma soli TaxID=1770529 RepID=A0ABW5M3A7_9BACT
MRILYLVGFIGWFSTLPALAQPVDTAKRMHYSVEIGGLAASSEQTPFWLRTNQYGTVPLRGSFGTLRLGVSRDYAPGPDSITKRKKRFDWGGGLFAVTNIGPASTSVNPAFLLPDAFVKVRFGKLELYGGNRREVIGLGDTVLTSGFVAWSGNALPFPKIQLHLPEFIPVPFTKKLIAIRAGYAHGWFANTYIQGSYLHQKYLYGRIGKPNWSVKIYAGINHQVQWGGHADYLINPTLSVNGNLPTSFQDYVSLVTGRYPKDIQNDRFTGFDGENRIGNHIGSYDLAVEWTRPKSKWLLYHQHIYEDASGLALQNVPDGLTGLRYANRSAHKTRFQIQRVVLEWLSTTNQSGSIFDQTARYQGGDNYFNHSQYREGWSYKGRTLGTPFIAPRTTLSSAVNNAYTGGGFFPDNRVIAWYTGIRGAFRQGPLLTLRASYSRNFGTFSQPYTSPFHQFSSLIMAQWPLHQAKGMELTTSFSVDRGDLLPKSTGGYLGLKKLF